MGSEKKAFKTFSASAGNTFSSFKTLTTFPCSFSHTALYKPKSFSIDSLDEINTIFEPTACTVVCLGSENLSKKPCNDLTALKVLTEHKTTVIEEKTNLNLEH